MTKETYGNILNFLKEEKLRLSNLVFERRAGLELNGKEEDEIDTKIKILEKSIAEFQSLEGILFQQ